ncbi:indole-3-glycerol phosphate synthase TrpC [Paratractidigestivibacter sp.]|uniref:indole-3-glycerol phosphate synthase TrpC n=1 Tax=Paratractidigestivibacter sp. TaxID=2847316 RepID=UPI002AC99292|nr:indole-3-glycerol phosphate synthase TrpC [Paratractidigestivibacter sp.]
MPAEDPKAGNILEKIAARTRERVEAEKREVPLAEMACRARAVATAELAASPTGEFAFPFEAALRAEGMSFICEVKKASPSKGLISPEFDPMAIAREYEAAGAAAVSCLTEPFWFQGADDYLTAIADAVSIPVLRKDFVVDEYMVYQARAIGASAVLLICSILNDEQLTAYVSLAHDLGLTALVEAYEPEEVPRAIAAGARVVGVNNRDLCTFQVDFGRSIDLRPMVGEGRVFVSESGVETRDDVARLEAAGVDAVLIGETLMRAADKRAMLGDLRGPAKGTVPSAGANAKPAKGTVPFAGPRVKLCGMCRDEDVDAVLAAAPDYCGFVVDFPKSCRSVTPERAIELGRALAGSGIARVGVFVDADPETIELLVLAEAIDAVQLHGHEDAAYVRDLRELLDTTPLGRKARIIQAFRVTCAADHAAADLAAAEKSPADLVLLDNGQGTGEAFDWSLLADGAPTRPARPFMLAGGLTPQNVAEAIAVTHPYAVDMSSGIESAGAAGAPQKDPQKMIDAVAAVRAAGKE